MEYSVVIHKAEDGGFWVAVPALPGCYSQGETLDETLENVKEAIELYLDVLKDRGQTVPRDSEVVFKVTVPV